MSVLAARLRAEVGSLAIDVELEAAPGTLVLVGPNGAGKSSVLELILGLRPVREGRVQVGDAMLLDIAAGIDVPVEARRLGYVPQDYALFPHLSVKDNVLFALRSAGGRLGRAEVAAGAHKLLSDLGLLGLAERQPSTLSGGEKQRLSLARALAIGPGALLLDEPLSALDARARSEVRALLASHLRKLALPTIVVTHDATDARALGERIAVIEAGTIVQQGSFEELVAAPASAFVEQLVSGAAA